MCRSSVALAVMVFLSGCGSGRPSADIERGKQAVVVALDAWKLNLPVGKLKTATDAVEFTEELRSTFLLTDYAIEKVDASDQEVIRFTVTLSLKDKKGKKSHREVVYAVALRDSAVVSRDPYF
jgi:hypothetical protein